MPNLFALLVGIDKYPPGIPTLSGCCNDIAVFETFLRERAGQGGFHLQVESLKDAQGSRQNVIDRFRQHLSRAGEGDVAVFYYSGHGSQNHTPPELWYLEPDHLDETLVCHDSRSPGKYDLADKELAVLIAEAAKSNPHILVILDCCHSGSGTRAPLEADGVKVRRAMTDTRVRPVDSYLTPAEESQRVVAGRTGNMQGRSRRLVPRGRHILMAACREDEEAKEILGDGQLRGVFSYCLTQSLQLTSGGLTYRDLFKRVNALVRIKTARQSPLIEVTDTGDLDMPLFGGAIQSHAPYFTASFDRDLGWVIDGGAVHGIPAPAPPETTRLAVFPVSSQPDQMEDSAKAIGEAAVTDRLPARSRITLQLKEGAPNEALTYHAAITSLPLPPLQFQLTGEGAAVELLRHALSTAGPGGGASQLVRESPTQADLRVIAGAEGYRIRRASDDRALVIDVEGATSESARQTIARLEHIARWTSVAELRNPASRLPADAVKLDLYSVAASGEETLIGTQESGAELRFGYEFVAGEWRRPTFKMRLLNQSGRRLYCMLLDMPETYGIYSALLAANGQWLDARASAWATYQGSMLIPGEVPAELVAQGLTEIKDTLKVIASTEECDATLLDQPDLDVHFEPGRGTTRGLAFSNTLANLMRRVQTRHFVQQPDALADWMTTQATLTISAPGKSVQVPRSGPPAGLSERVRLLPHAGLKAIARISAAVTSSRDPDLPALPPLPPWLIDDPEVVQPFEFSPSRGGEAGLSVLELNDVDPESAATVTRESPLQLRVQAPLGNDQQILPVSFDGEFFLPVGWGRAVDGEVEINIERLPDPSTNRRTLTGSIRIFFNKVVSKYLGTEYAYPLLGIVDRIEAGGMRYAVDPEVVRSRVRAAKRILLYIHGIIGDTRGLAASAFSWGLVGRTESSPFDLVLTFDYENLNTPIEETARNLKLRLTEAGLEPGCVQEVYVVAHSMGGLVARWFIEREGGEGMIRHLVMLGTPNGGSPWPRIVDWATTVIAFGLNGLSKMHWPPTVLGTLARIATKIGAATADRLGKIEVALDEMSPGSSFLQELGRTSQIRVRYSIVAGNTSLVPAALEEENGHPSRIQRLLRRLNPRRVASEQATLTAFFGLPNDIAVSVEAIGKLPPSIQQSTLVREVACDHLTYFNSDAGMKAVLDILH